METLCTLTRVVAYSATHGKPDKTYRRERVGSEC
jgi:hypothetical protein